MNKNYRSSLCKWNAGLWNRLNNWHEKWLEEYSTHNSRRSVWGYNVWKTCGFCREFPTCGNCPLGHDGHCETSWMSVPDKSVLRKIRKAWEDNQPRTFEKYRLEFYNILKSHKDRFKED